MNEDLNIELTVTEKLNQLYADRILDAYQSNQFNVQITIDFMTERELKIPFNLNHAVKTLESVMRSLSKRLFKTAYKRFDKRLKFVAVVEPAPTTKRLHTHILTRVPSSVSLFKFEQILRSVIAMNDYIPKKKEALKIQPSDNSNAVNLYQLKPNEDPNERMFLYEVTDAHDQFKQMIQEKMKKHLVQTNIRGNE